ncbi:MAG: PAAR domain-containing protein [Gemmataceae bacterium]
MPQPAACITFPHVCPMFTGPVPHVGGPIVGPGAPTVLIMDLPAACLGDVCVCVGPPSAVVFGSPTVLFEDRPAARMGDPTAHGGVIVLGVPTVLIGP